MTILNKLQNYRWTTQNIKIFIHYLKTVKKPDDKYKDFAVINNTLYYTPLQLVVIPEDNPKIIRDKLEEIYELPSAIGKGQNNFFKLVVSRYLGIRRRDVIDFLKTKPVYQLAQNKPKIYSKGIQATKPFQYWCIDLVDMNYYNNVAANRHYRYIFSCMDIFTKFCWFVAIKSKDAPSCLNAFKEILKYNLRFGDAEYPKTVCSDNGAEFKGELDVFFKEHRIRHLTTKSYTPEPHIEQLNGNLRAMMRQNFIKTNSLAWLPYLQSFMDSKNTNINESTRQTPLALMEHYFAGNHSQIKETADKVRTKNEERIKKFQNQEDFQLGQPVRVKLTAFQSALRKKEKEVNKKLIVVRFSPQIYYISKITPTPKGKFGYPKYQLKDTAGNIVKSDKGYNKSFISSDLLKIGEATPQSHRIDLSRANFLNRVKDEVADSDEGESHSDQEENIPKPVRIITPKSVLKYVSADWNNVLKGKIFNDFDHTRSKIIKVYYSKSDRAYVVEYADADLTKVLAKDTRYSTLQEVLELSKGESWYLPEYADVITKYSTE